VTTPQLWQPSHSEGHRALAELVLRLRDQSGLDFARIATQLNCAGVLSPRGKPIYPQLVYSIYRKWTARMMRERRNTTVVLKEVLILPAAAYYI